MIYINDLPDCASGTCKIPADDAKLYDFSSMSKVFEKHLNSLQRWSDLWQLQ